MHKVLAVAALVIATAGLADSWSPRASDFRKNAAAERKRLGLDAEKAKKQYPTPEVRFGAAGWACPGETTTVLLEGKLSPGTLVGTSSADVEILKEELTAKGWQGTFKVKPGAKGPITLELIAPVSGIGNDIELPIGCPREWVIDFKDGTKLVVKVIDTERRGAGEWFRGAALVEARAFQLSTDGKSFTLFQQDNAEDRERVKKAQEPLTRKDAAERQKALSLKMQACATKAPSEMAPCMQKYSAELQEIMAAQQSAVQTAQAAAAPKVGCVQLTGTIEGKKLKGNGTNCAAVKNPYDQQPFTGIIR